MKTILIPVDFTSTSLKALEVAATIAKRISAKIMLTHMVGVEDGYNSSSCNVEQMIFYKKTIGKKFSKFINQPFLERLIVEPLLQKQLDFAGVNTLAKEIDASLIIMGSHGCKGLAEALKGSNAEKVVRNAEVPVLVVKENDMRFVPERILYASDFNLETVSAYRRIIEVSKLLGVFVEFLYVNLPGNSFQSTNEMDEKLLEFFKAVNHTDPVNAIKTVTRYADYSVEQGVINYAVLSGADIIAIPTHGRKGLAHFLQGSIGEDIANHAIKPVLTVKM